MRKQEQTILLHPISSPTYFIIHDLGPDLGLWYIISVLQFGVRDSSTWGRFFRTSFLMIDVFSREILIIFCNRKILSTILPKSLITASPVQRVEIMFQKMNYIFQFFILQSPAKSKVPSNLIFTTNNSWIMTSHNLLSLYRAQNKVIGA